MIFNFTGNHYKLTVHMTALNSSINLTEEILPEYELNTENSGEVGFIWFDIISKNSSESTGLLEFSPNSNHFKPGFSYTAVLAASDVGIPSAVIFKWLFDRSWVKPWTWRIEKPFIFVEQIDLESMEYGVK